MLASPRLPQDFLKTNYLRIAIPAGKIAEAIMFYKDSLLLKTTNEINLHTYINFQFGNIQLLLEEIEGNVHQSYLSMEVKDLLLAQLFLDDRNIDFDFIEPINGQDRLIFQDPFGNTFEFIEIQKPNYNKIK